MWDMSLSYQGQNPQKVFVYNLGHVQKFDQILIMVQRKKKKFESRLKTLYSWRE